MHEGKVKDPLLFLESIMSGQDPRELSKVYSLIMDIEEFLDGEPPSRNDWMEVVDLVSNTYKFRTVSASESVGAAKTLAEYLHAKRKQVDVNNGANGPDLVEPLTEDDIDLFKEKFNDDY